MRTGGYPYLCGNPPGDRQRGTDGNTPFTGNTILSGFRTEFRQMANIR